MSFKDCSINTPRRSNYWWILDKNYIVKIKEHIKHLCKKVFKKRILENRYNKFSVNISWSGVKSIVTKWKAHAYICLQLEWPCREGSSEGGQQDTCDSFQASTREMEKLHITASDLLTFSNMIQCCKIKVETSNGGEYFRKSLYINLLIISAPLLSCSLVYNQESHFIRSSYDLYAKTLFSKVTYTLGLM